MNLEFNIFSLTLLISGFIVAALSAIIINRLNDYVRWFAFTMLLVALWSMAYGLELASSSLEVMLFWIKVEYIGISFAPAAWLWFCFKYVGYEKWQTKTTFIGIFLIPIITYSLVLTNEFHNYYYSDTEMVLSGPFPLLKFTRGTWYFVHMFYFYLTLLFGNILLFIRFKNTDPVYRKQTYTIIAGGVIPWLVNLTYILGFSPFEYIDLTPYSFLILYIIIGIGLLKFDLFDIKPIARDKVIQAMTTGILVFDPQNRVIDFNPYMLRLLGRSENNFIGQSLDVVFEDYPEIVDTAYKQKKGELDLKMSFLDDKRDFHIDFIPLLDQKSIFSGLLLQFDDVTDDIVIRERLIHQTDELQKLNNLKDKLFSIISHDLKGPIFGIRELVKLTADGTISQEEFIDILPEVSKNMDSVSLLLENLLAWTSTQLRGEFVDKNRFDLTNLLKQEYALFEKIANEKNIVLEVKTEEDLYAFADKNMIDLVIRNLISNALKFSNRGDQVSLIAKKKNNQLMVKIADSGAGISKENLNKLNNGESFTTNGVRNETGTGLGLILVKDYIAKNGGSLQIKSELNVGSEFEFSLPIYKDELITN